MKGLGAVVGLGMQGLGAIGGATWQGFRAVGGAERDLWSKARFGLGDIGGGRREVGGGGRLRRASSSSESMARPLHVTEGHVTAH